MRSLPKAHLHLHLEHCVRPETLRELADRNGVCLDTFFQFATLGEFLEHGAILRGCITRLDDLSRICRELIEDEANDGVRYLEPMVTLSRWVPQLGTFEEVFHTVQEALSNAGKEYGVEVGIMLGFSRHRDSLQTVQQLANFAALHTGDGVVSFGFGGDEMLAGPELFETACKIAREAGSFIVPHAGEVMGADSIAKTIELLQPKRIAHGVRAAESDEVLKLLAEKNIPCDVCPTSNLRLGVFSDIKKHPIKHMLDAGVKVTLNADDPLEFGVRASNEYELVRDEFNFSDKELAGIARTSVEYSGASQATRDRISQEIENWLAEV